MCGVTLSCATVDSGAALLFTEEIAVVRGAVTRLVHVLMYIESSNSSDMFVLKHFAQIEVLGK